MNPFNYYHGITFPDSIQKKISNLTDQGHFPALSPVLQLNRSFLADRFNADGTPTVFDPKTIYPCYTAQYLGTPIPESLLEVPQGYSSHASVAAYKWLQKITMGGRVDLTHFDGECFDATIEGENVHFTFPTTQFHMFHHNPAAAGPTPTHYSKSYAVIPWPDVSDNNDDWKDGTIPAYAEQQAHLLLWCWWYTYDVLKHRTSCPVDCFIVRITGNTPGDITVRTVHSDPQKQAAIAARVVKRIKGKANPAEDNMRVRKQGTWLERKQAEDEDAYRVEDPNVYALVRDYMEARTRRKTLEAQSDDLKNQMDALAIKLAELTPSDTDIGTVVDVTPTGMGKVMYQVKHTRKALRPSDTVSADLVMQFFPEYSGCVTTTVKQRGSVTVEAAV